MTGNVNFWPLELANQAEHADTTEWQFMHGEPMLTLQETSISEELPRDSL